ncbi:hypothetical protein KSB_88280 [Ktedonobacter robiniae]|uniref:DUF3298 domain-containing protein n=1 Tax=Ktedonobacter robiniae TaxID=2778365 RepID=A0ABQ3V5Q6_9CHLR|nr:hypothetical protein KSB_88280 [Ktedonobacter robiniae]
MSVIHEISSFSLTSHYALDTFQSPTHVFIFTQPPGRYLAFYDHDVEALPQLYLVHRSVVKSFITE